LKIVILQLFTSSSTIILLEIIVLSIFNLAVPFPACGRRDATVFMIAAGLIGADGRFVVILDRLAGETCRNDH